MSWFSQSYALRELEINPEKIRGKGRPRFGGGKAYKTASDSFAEKEIKEAWAKLCGTSFCDWTDELRVWIDYQRPYPDSYAKYKQGMPDLVVPDVDNVAKTVLDALNKTAWKDDAQITELHIKKWPRFFRRSSYLKIRVEYISNTPPQRRKHD
ncbi:MAG: RusA family crossover junction endodeoxyribonuclease [Gordonibacter sp.]|uniref:RusA family crossover junction endodeoxyribonuclease n=1 Tax=Gordonibacter sp. TaxID=1968902 RepID=UPI002FC8A0EC